MKEKRYLCDRMNQPMRPQWSRAIICSSIILAILASIALYNLDIKYGAQLLGEYSEEAYANLEEIADGVIEEHVINLDTISDGVSKYEVTYNHGELTFKCDIDQYQGKKLYPSASITVTESSGVVKKERNVSSEEEYIKIQKRGRLVGCAFNGMFICVVVLAVIFAAILVLYVISLIHKLIDTKKRP